MLSRVASHPTEAQLIVRGTDQWPQIFAKARIHHVNVRSQDTSGHQDRVDVNRTSANATGAIISTQGLAYNEANQITMTGYSYDGGGNLTAPPTAADTFNAAEQMTSSKNTSSGIATNYTYAGAAQNAVLSETSANGATINTTQDRASGLVKFGIRWYDPTTGTWTQQDTLDAPLDPINRNHTSKRGIGLISQ